jgi:hypothetical protein
MTRVNRLKTACLISALFSLSVISVTANARGEAAAGAVGAVKTAAVDTQASATPAAGPAGGPDGSAPTAVPTLPPESPTVYGLAMPIVIYPDNPSNTHTYNGIIWYQPEKWRWHNLNVYIAGRFGHWWSDGAREYRALNIYSVAPVLRYYFFKMRYFSPFAEVSVGPGYMTRTQFGNRNLGMHFTFQDELGIGVVAGKEAGFYATASILHYSNAHLSAHNSGITVPLMLTIGYQFN